MANIKFPKRVTTPVSVAPLMNIFPSHRFVRTEETLIHRAHPASSPFNEAQIRVLNWNIAKNNDDDDWIADFYMILEQYQPNLIFLQEVRLCRQTREIVELAKLGWNFAPNFIDNYHNIYAGVLTASSVSCVNRRAFTTQHHEPVTRTPKVSLFTEYPLSDSDETLLTINTHLINFVELEKFQAQLAEIEAAIAAHSGAVILSGDFNTWNRSRWYMLVSMTRRLGLTRAKFPPEEAQNIKRFLLSPPLDHVFYRGLRQNYLQAWVLKEITSSDHKPMLVEFYR